MFGKRKPTAEAATEAKYRLASHISALLRGYTDAYGAKGLLNPYARVLIESSGDMAVVAAKELPTSGVSATIADKPTIRALAEALAATQNLDTSESGQLYELVLDSIGPEAFDHAAIAMLGRFAQGGHDPQPSSSAAVTHLADSHTSFEEAHLENDRLWDEGDLDTAQHLAKFRQLLIQEVREITSGLADNVSSRT